LLYIKAKICFYFQISTFQYWRKNIGLIVAGVMLGEGLMTGIGTSVVIIYEGIFALPY